MKEKSEKRTAILDATLKLIAKHGFHSTSMSMIVKESKVSTGIIYHYFVSKEEIIMELYKIIKFTALKAMVKNCADDLTIQERYKNIWLESLNYCRLHPKEISFLEQFEYSPYLTPCLSEEFASVMQPISDLIEESMEEGVVKKLPINIFVKLFNEGAVLLGKKYSGKNDIPDGKLVELTYKACWDAVKI
jgi:AcrR family transcriptional regulator